jgi:hypothetical protein
MVGQIYEGYRKPVRKSTETRHGDLHQTKQAYQLARNEGQPLRSIMEQAAYCVLTFCGSFRGWETPKLVLSYLIEFSKNAQTGDTPKGVKPHVTLPLAGRFNLRGNMDQNVLVFLAEESKSGLKPRVWVDRLIEVLDAEGKSSGWAFQRSDRSQAKMRDYSDKIFEKFLERQAQRPDLLPAEVDISEAIGLGRSWRRGAVSQAGDQGVWMRI